jgi:hypothetical protein
MQLNLMVFINLRSWSQLQGGNQYSSEHTIQGIEDKKFSIASTSQLSSSQNLLKQRHHLDSNSPSNITYEAYEEKFGPSSGSFAQRNLKGNVTSETPDGVSSGCSEHVRLSCTLLV